MNSKGMKNFIELFDPSPEQWKIIEEKMFIAKANETIRRTDSGFWNIEGQRGKKSYISVIHITKFQFKGTEIEFPLKEFVKILLDVMEVRVGIFHTLQTYAYLKKIGVKIKKNYQPAPELNL